MREVAAQKKFLTEVQDSVVPSTWWTHDEAGHNAEAKNEPRAVGGEGEELFITPRPERLLRRILEIGSNPGDLILDSFAGSGTTGAVAHKMARRWIMVELGEHCHTHIIPRLKKVIDGEDPGGVTEAVGWKGGGGFRYCRLAPSDSVYWQHGHSTERDFIYVTTASLTHEQLQQLSDEVGTDRSLLALCTAFRGRGYYVNLTAKKIPKQVLSRCEWGHDDYSLQVENLPKAATATLTPDPSPGGRGEAKNPGQQALFGEEDVL